MSVEGSVLCLEVWRPSGASLVPLADPVITIGKSERNTLRIETDQTVSRVHAVIERLGSIWCIRDLGSRNGRSVNGRRVTAQQALHPGDEIRVGGTRLVLRSVTDPRPEPETRLGAVPPDMTRRERDVLVALCRPLMTGGAFCQPASTKEIAGALAISEAAVKQHLLHLYDKFGVYGVSERRRIQLANEALQRGALTFGDLGS